MNAPSSKRELIAMGDVSPLVSVLRIECRRRFDSIPNELKSVKGWVCWRITQVEPVKGKFNKVPVYPATGLNRRGTQGGPEDLQALGMFDEAARAFDEDPTMAGIGLAMLPAFGIVALDVDRCIEGDELRADAQVLTAETYCEVSPSGTGIRAFWRGTARDGKDHERGFELFHSKGFVTITGNVVPNLHSIMGTGALPLLDAATRNRLETLSSKTQSPDESPVAPLVAIPTMGHEAIDWPVIESAVAAINPDCSREEWIKVGMALHSHGTQVGQIDHAFTVWDNWSRNSESKYPGERQITQQWASFREDKATAVTMGSVFKLAGEAGWTRPQVDASGLFSPTGGQDLPQAQHPLARFLDCAGPVMPPRWVIPGFIAHGVVVVSGSPGVGKTTAMLPLAMTVAGLHGDDALIPREWRHVVYISEDVEQAKRILAGIAGHGILRIAHEAVRERIHIVEAVRLAPSYVATVGKTYREEFTRMVAGVAVLPLVVIDTKSAVLALESENDNSEASAMMAALKQGFDGLPVWLIGHLAKQNLGRNDVLNLSSRGAGAIEGDANQTMFLVREGDNRFLVLGKTRFEPQWPELAITSHTATITAKDEFGKLEAVTLRWGIARPGQKSRKEAAEQAAALAREREEATLRQDILKAVESAWQAGDPLNRARLREKIPRNNSVVGTAIENLLAERWLHEVEVPAKERIGPSRARFLVGFWPEEHEVIVRSGELPAYKLVIPPRWKKSMTPIIPAPPVPNPPVP